MKIVVDDKIPYIRETLAGISDDVVYLKGSEIKPTDVADAQALIVRTRTKCDEALLGGSRVEFVATATIGFDHIDTEYMRRSGTEWMNCPGCNSGSVAQYLRSVLILLCRERGYKPGESTVGVVGYGHVGRKVADVARQLGFGVIVCDPPLKDAGCSYEDFIGMERIEQDADIITFHVPLTADGAYPTRHLADGAFFERIGRRPTIINSSRGAVVDNGALLAAIRTDRVADAVIDTWENEPEINRELLDRVYIGTPHIAGYSADGKTNADNMVIDGLCRHFNIPNRWHIEPPQLPADFSPCADADELALRLYDPREDSERLKHNPDEFEELRGNYHLRREKL